MSHQLEHKPYELIRASDWDRIIQLLRNGVTEYSSGIAQLLNEMIGLQQLDPALAALLNTLAQIVIPIQDAFNVISASSVTLAQVPLSGSETVYINGLFQERGTDYTIVGKVLSFSPSITGRIVARYETAQLVTPTILGSSTLGYNHIKALDANLAGQLEVYGNASGYRVSEFLMVNLAQIVPPQTVVSDVDVRAGTPDKNMLIRTGGYMWAIGEPTGGGTNTITKINEINLVSSIITVTTDTAVTISSITTDGNYIYAFMKGGTFIAPNTIAKLDLTGAPVGVIGTGLTVTGGTSMVVSNLGFIYMSFDDPTVKKVMKFDPVPATGLLKTFSFAVAPTQVLPVNSDIYVLNGTNLTKISGVSDTVTVLQTYGFTPSTMAFDGSDLWIASGDTLRKCKADGTVLHAITPEPGQTIQYILPAFGFIWVTYSNDTTLNITKVFPGISGV